MSSHAKGKLHTPVLAQRVSEMRSASRGRPAESASERAEFVEYMRGLGGGKQASIQELDKHTLTLAAGALTLSIGVMQLTGLGRAVHRLELLRWAWSLLVASMLATVVSLVLSACSYWYLTWRIRRSYEQGGEWRRHRASALRFGTRGLTILGPLLLCAGLAILAAFTFSEIRSATMTGGHMTNESKTPAPSKPDPTISPTRSPQPAPTPPSQPKKDRTFGVDPELPLPPPTKRESTTR